MFFSPHPHLALATCPAQVHTMLGRGFSLLMCAVMILYPFGSCIAYLVICGEWAELAGLAAGCR